MLQDPTNGKIIVYGDTAFFVCLSGTVVMGNPILTCINGTWSNPPPTCKLLNPQNRGMHWLFAIVYMTVVLE